MLRGQSAWPPPPPAPAEHDAGPVPDLADVRGQALGRRALEVAAAGSHHLLMIGPPGSGKTMLAERLPGLLPPLSPDEALDGDTRAFGRRRRPPCGCARRTRAVPRAAPPGFHRVAGRRRQLVAAAR